MMITFDCKDSFIFSDTKTFVKEMFEKNLILTFHVFIFSTFTAEYVFFC